MAGSPIRRRGRGRSGGAGAGDPEARAREIRETGPTRKPTQAFAVASAARAEWSTKSGDAGSGGAPLNLARLDAGGAHLQPDRRTADDSPDGLHVGPEHAGRPGLDTPLERVLSETADATPEAGLLGADITTGRQRLLLKISQDSEHNPTRVPAASTTRPPPPRTADPRAEASVRLRLSGPKGIRAHEICVAQR